MTAGLLHGSLVRLRECENLGVNQVRFHAGQTERNQNAEYDEPDHELNNRKTSALRRH
jgi:hypothetical protein